MNPEQREFHLKEFDSIRAEVSLLLARIENLFKYSFVASATVFAWLLTNSIGVDGKANPCLRSPASLLTYAWAIPFAFSYAAMGLAFVNQLRVQKMGKYLLKLEGALGNQKLGWESFSQPGFPVLTTSVGVVWILLVAGTTYAGKTGIQQFKVAEQNKAVCQSE
jgi:hypothetical protein